LSSERLRVVCADPLWQTSANAVGSPLVQKCHCSVGQASARLQPAAGFSPPGNANLADKQFSHRHLHNRWLSHFSSTAASRPGEGFTRDRSKPRARAKACPTSLASSTRYRFGLGVRIADYCWPPFSVGFLSGCSA